MARLIVFAGLPGVGKSTLARQVAQRLGAVWLRIDSMDQAIWDSGTAPEDLRDWTYRAAQAAAQDNLRLGLDVVGDCVNDVEAARAGWEGAARLSGSSIVWLEIVCGDKTAHRRRIESRIEDVPGLRTPSWPKVRARAFEPMSRNRFLADTAGKTVAQSVAELLGLLEGARAANCPDP
ncbi:MAG: AAA family ATPase [Caulobacteraceae bacterium]